jgi:hypothetical protein
MTSFVCVNCSKTCHLSSRRLFLNLAGVRRHINASKACFAAGLGFLDIRVDALAGDVMAGLGGAAGPSPDVRHQSPGKKYTCTVTVPVIARTLVAKWLRQLAGMHKVIGSNPTIIQFFYFVKNLYMRVWSCRYSV